MRISREKIVDFQTAFGAADARAKAWRGDATVVKAAHTFTPLDPEGRSKRWYIDFYSPSAQGSAQMTIDDGVITCTWASSPRTVRVPALSAGFQRDVKQLLTEGAAHGGSELLLRGYGTRVELRIGSRRRWFRFTLGDPIRFYWYVDYLHPTRTDVLRLTFDANDGRFVESETYHRSR